LILLLVLIKIVIKNISKAKIPAKTTESSFVLLLVVVLATSLDYIKLELFNENRSKVIMKYFLEKVCCRIGGLVANI